MQVLRELRALAEELGVEDRVVFLTNVTDAQRCGTSCLQCLVTPHTISCLAGAWRVGKSLRRGSPLDGCCRCCVTLRRQHTSACTNWSTYASLVQLARPCALPTLLHVALLTAQTAACRRALIDASKGMIYTPQNEHFGIVPLEAMARGCPVVACNSGGPLETVVHTQTGFIAEPTALCFANAMVLLLTLKADAAAEMRAAARARVRDAFSRQTFARSWRAVLAGEALVDAVKKVA